MSDLPPPQAPSVVLDTNATVKVRRWPVIAAALAAAAFVTYFVLALVIDDSETYVMGPAATALQDGYELLGTSRSLDTEELRCIDESAAGIDPASLDQLSPGILAGEAEDPAMRAFAGRVMDDCLQPESRQAIMATEFTMDGSMTAEQAACMAEAVDGAVMDVGGYTQMIDDPNGMGPMVAIVVLRSLEDCGVDMADMMGG